MKYAQTIIAMALLAGAYFLGVATSHRWRIPDEASDKRMAVEDSRRANPPAQPDGRTRLQEPSDVPDLLRRLRDVDDVATQAARALEIFEAVDTAALISAIESLERQPPSSLRTILLARAYEVWGERTPGEAISRAQGLPAGAQQRATEAVIRGWAKNEPENAWTWAVGNPTKPGFIGTMKYLEAALESISAKKQFARGGALIDAMPEDLYHEARYMLARKHVQLWSADDLQGAEQWISSQTSIGVRKNGFSALAESLVSTDPKLAVEWLDGLHPADRAAAVGSATRKWIDTGGLVEAAEWAARLPPGPANDGAFAQLSLSLIYSDANLAHTFALAQEKDRSRDSILTSGVRVLTRSDPAAAIQWAQSLSTPEVAERHTREVFNVWRKSDPTMAEQFVRNSPEISDDLKRELLNQGPEP